MKNTVTDSAFEYIKSSGGIDEYRLQANDLTVLLLEDHAAPVVTFMVTYHVGSRNEAIGYTGSTHILEHMMFKGSEEYNREKGTRITEVLQNLGARVNATTWMDRTNYYELLPSEHLEEGIKVEADRMRTAFIRDEDRQSEMTVVRNEFERGENDPFNVLDKNIWATAFQAHPYHHSTIGWRSDIENVPTARLKEFYDTYYWPNNATVTVIGDFTAAEVLAQVDKYFGRHSRSPKPIPAMYTTEPIQEGPRRLEIRRTGQTGIVGIAHKIPDGRNADIYAVQILSNILGGGKSSRLYRKLIDSGLATNLFLWDFAFHDNGLLITYVFLTPGTDHEAVEKIILAEYADIKTNGVSEAELKRARAQLRSDIAFSRDGSFSIASSINEAIAAGDWTLYTTQLERYNAVRSKDVQAVAQKYLVEDRSTTGWFVPKVSTALSAGPATVHQPQAWRSDEGELIAPVGVTGLAVPAGAIIAKQVVEKEVLDGLQVYTVDYGVKDVVTIAGSFLGGDVYSPPDNPELADMVAEMLDQGTRRRDKHEISEMLESVGASIDFNSGKYRVKFNVHCLKDDLPLVLELLAEQLREPAFPADELEIVKQRIIGALERTKENTNRQAQVTFSQALYPVEHPNHQLKPDVEIEFIKKVTTDDIKRYYEQNYGLGSMLIVAAGDVNNRILTGEIKKAFGGWKKSGATELAVAATTNPLREYTEFVTIPEKTSADLYFGQALGINRNHVDFYPLMMGLYILGGNFSARLMSTVRDQQGLTYGIEAGLGGFDGNADGYWYIWGTFAPEMLETGHQAALEQAKLWATDGVTAEELANKKTTITGSFKVGLATTRGIAGQVLSNAEKDRPVDYLDRYPQIINDLTLEQVNGAIRRHVNLDRLIYVAAGAIDKAGQPTGKE
ncbi:MAG: pitrilysin family protein [Candidatus Neomarinimicrobiota bacterium]